MSPLAKVFILGRSADTGGLPNRRIRAEIDATPTYVNVGQPTVAVPGHARDAAGVIPVQPRSIPPVLRSIREAEIASAVVKHVAIPVVDASCGIRGNPQDDSVDADLRRRHPSYATLNVMPQIVQDEGYVVLVDYRPRSIQVNLDISEVALDPDARRFIALPSTPRVAHG